MHDTRLLSAAVLLLVLLLLAGQAHGAAYVTRLLRAAAYNRSATMPVSATGPTGAPALLVAVDFETPAGATCNKLVLDVALRRLPANATALLPYTTSTGTGGDTGKVAMWLWSNSTVMGLQNTLFAPSKALFSANVSADQIKSTTLAALPPALAAQWTTAGLAPPVGRVRVVIPTLSLPLLRGVYWLGLTVVLPTGATSSSEVRLMTEAPVAGGGASRYGVPYEVVDAFGTARPMLPLLHRWTTAAQVEPYLMPLDFAGPRSSSTGELSLALYASCTPTPGVFLFNASDARVLATGLPALTQIADVADWTAMLPPTPTPVPTPIELPSPTPVPTPIGLPSPTPVPTPIGLPSPTPVPTPVGLPISTPVPTPVGLPSSTPVPTPIGFPSSTSVPTPIGLPSSTSVPTPIGLPISPVVTTPTPTTPSSPSPSTPTVPTGPVPTPDMTNTSTLHNSTLAPTDGAHGSDNSSGPSVIAWVAMVVVGVVLLLVLVLAGLCIAMRRRHNYILALDSRGQLAYTAMHQQDGTGTGTTASVGITLDDSHSSDVELASMSDSGELRAGEPSSASSSGGGKVALPRRHSAATTAATLATAQQEPRYRDTPDALVDAYEERTMRPVALDESSDRGRRKNTAPSPRR